MYMFHTVNLTNLVWKQNFILILNLKKVLVVPKGNWVLYVSFLVYPIFECIYTQNCRRHGAKAFYARISIILGFRSIDWLKMIDRSIDCLPAWLTEFFFAEAPPTNPSELPNSCSPNKCLNGAACIEGKNTFYCVCPEHTSGRLCEKKTTPTTGMNVWTYIFHFSCFW